LGEREVQKRTLERKTERGGEPGSRINNGSKEKTTIREERKIKTLTEARL